MGASVDSNVFEQEEQALIQEAYYIGLGKRRSAANDEDIVKVFGGVWSGAHFLKYANESMIHSKNEGKHTRIEEAFAKIQTVEELRVIGILLGQASFLDKTDLLFGVFAEHGRIDAEKLTNLLKTVSKVCLDILGHLVTDGQDHDSSRVRNEHYISLCKQYEDRWVQESKAGLTGFWSKDEFAKAFGTKTELTSPQFFRRHVFKEAKSKPQGALSKSSTSSAFSRLRAVAVQQA